MIYYAAGEAYAQGRVKGYEEFTYSPDGPESEKAKYTKVDNIQYDDFILSNGKTAAGKVSAQTIEEADYQVDAVTKETVAVISSTANTKTITAYNEYGLATAWQDSVVSGGKTTTSSASCSYDDMGFMTGYDSSVLETSNDPSLSLNKSYNFNKSNILYNVLGQAISWTQTTTNATDASDIIAVSTVTVEYDEYGRMSRYSEDSTRSDKNDADNFSETTQLIRSDFVYNTLGQTIGWQETIDSEMADRRCRYHYCLRRTGPHFHTNPRCH